VVGLQFLVGTSVAATGLLQLRATFGLAHSQKAIFYEGLSRNQDNLACPTNGSDCGCERTNLIR